MVREEAISVLLGYTSMACWLGAQLPQIVVNWRRKSVDGLALPFLANWLLGDATNLIGCLLTDQLPFQTYLATYFVLVDICLLSQFFYYDAPRHAKSLSALASPSARTSLLLPSAIAYSPQAHTLPSTNLSRSRSRSYSFIPHLSAAVANMTVATSELEARQHDAHNLDVEVHSSQRRWRSRGSQRAVSLEGLPESVIADQGDREWGGRRVSPERQENEAAADGAVEAESESTPSLMIESFHSEGGGRGRSGGKHVSWSRDNTSRDRGHRRLSHDQPESPNTAPSTVRGRQLTRPTMYDSPVAAELPPTPLDTLPRSRRPSTASSISAAANRRSAGIVFLGVFALLGLSSQAGYRMRGDMQGQVLSARATSGDIVTSAQEAMLGVGINAYTAAASGETKRLIGRVSAWTCTTMYITSRLPQIWKNFVRKSVEGLSMYLFIFAFLGNFFYVLSILTSPKMDQPPPLAAKFLHDSVPYLLGSGGTLLFDVTIVMQSVVYKRTGRRRRRTAEERGLLAEVESH